MKRMTALVLILLLLLTGCAAQSQLEEMENNPYVTVESDTTTEKETTATPPNFG